MSDEPAVEPVKKAKEPAGKKVAGPDPTVPLKLRWDLRELPSSQHRAGLAGLAMCVAFLQRKPGRKGICRAESIDDAGLTLIVDRQGMQDLFDEVYAASFEERPEKKIRTNKAKKEIQPDRVEEREVQDKNGRTKTELRYIYRQPQPAGDYFDDLEQEVEGEKIWLRFWRSFVWDSTHNRARGPYQDRLDGKQVDDGGDAWDGLHRVLIAGKRTRADEVLSGTHMLAVEAFNDDAVAFLDREENRFLLRFWRFSVSLYSLVLVGREKPQGELIGNVYCVAVPEVTNLAGFADAWPHFLRGRGSAKLAFRPRESVIDVAAEAGLRLMSTVGGAISSHQAAASSMTVRAVEVFIFEKSPQTTAVTAVRRVDAKRSMLDEYAIVCGSSYWSPLFRRQRIGNVVDEKPWWWGFARLCATSPQEVTIGHDAFCHDARVAMKEAEMTETPDVDMSIEHLIFKRVQAYVLGKTEKKYALNWAEVKNNPGQKAEYENKKEKVAKEAFLAVRSRTGADFVTYFTSTICSVPHGIPEAKYLEIARALMDPKGVEMVRSLTLLSLSAVA